MDMLGYDIIENINYPELNKMMKYTSDFKDIRTEYGGINVIGKCVEILIKKDENGHEFTSMEAKKLNKCTQLVY